MVSIPIDDADFQAAVEKAVKAVLARDAKRVEEMTERLLDEAKASQRVAISELEQSKEAFRLKAKESIADAEATISTFRTSVDKKTTEMKDALNVKVLAVFTSLVIILTFGAIAYLGDRLEAVREKSKDATTASSDLAAQSKLLQGQIETANTIYKSAFESNKDANLATQLATLSALTARISTDVDGLKAQTAPIVKDWSIHHPKGQGTKPE